MATSEQIGAADNPGRPGPRPEVGDRGHALLALAEETPEQRAADAAAVTRLAHHRLDADGAAEVLDALGIGGDAA
ncbi:hypothetical protein F4561_006598 [Lipingzhangella halophila]|uniref:Uncharacterized protein n=1 Tax=Lipingzhangella halophila TaxID=1783352 RepID=A0A7W7RPB9_9ACTN|nr:hypothetical protein [Lipingzhangella halophila]MBB4935689.1 hypothetical protein [Lipingzhangella halophila]